MPEVKTTADPIENGEPSTTSPKPENDSAAAKHESNGDGVKHEAITHIQEENSKKRAREEGEPPEMEPDAKKVDTKEDA